MKKNSSYKYAIVYSTVALALASCNSGKNNQAWQDVKAPNSDQKVLIDNICGNDGVTNLSINEAGGEPINPSLQLGNSKGLRAYVNCVNGTNFDVTSTADWASSNHDIFSVNNKNSKGYLISKNLGSAYLTVSYLGGLFSANYKLNIVDAELKQINIFMARESNQIYAGETINPVIEGTYSNGAHSTISNATLITDNESIIKITDSSVTALQTGKFNLTAKLDNLTTTIAGEVVDAKPIGITINAENKKDFITGIPTKAVYTAKLVLSNGNLIDIPKNTFDHSGITSCKLQKLPNDNSMPFIQSDNGCTINTTRDSGENKLIYNYDILDSNNAVKQSFESSIIIKSSDSQIKSLSLETDNDLANGGMIVGEIYRYHVYANLINQDKVDVTKVVPVKATLMYNGSDNSSKIIISDTGYTGALTNSYDDEKGGVIKLTDYIIKDNLDQKTVQLTLDAQLTKFNAKFDKTINVMPNTLTVKQLSSYFADSFYPRLQSVDKRKFKTINGFDAVGNPSETNSSLALINLKDNQLSATVLDDTEGSLTLKDSSTTVDVAIDTTIPRINKVYGSDDASLSIATIACNNASTPQTISTAEKMQNVIDTTTISRALTIGIEQSIELDASFLDVVGAKSTTKFSTSANRTWTDSTTKTNQYRLAPQNVLLQPKEKAVVVQKVFKSLFGYTGKFDIPLTENSCIPFTINGKINDFSLYSPACMKYADIGNKPNDSIFNRLFSGNNSLTFYANYASDTGNEAVTTNTIAIYVYKPGDVAYNELVCEGSSLQSSNKATLSISKNQLQLKGNQITLSPKNLTKIQTIAN